MFSCVVPEKPIELLQGEFLPYISIGQAPLELQKTLEFVCHRATERGGHWGTGKATSRNRPRETRTYTEVEDGQR